MSTCDVFILVRMDSGGTTALLSPEYSGDDILSLFVCLFID
ncbi:hypothetical protein [[Haemophilus] ducreyi]|nr:hypothetical protein [[Haemophilus] ducreyi]